MPNLLDALPALGSVASSLIGNSANVRLAREQRAHDLKMWNLQNEYNTPAAQKRRMLDAGINPALGMMNGMMSSGTASSSAGGQTAPTVDFSPIGQGLRDSVELFQQRRMQDSQIDNMEANTIAQNQRNRFGMVNAYVDLLNNIAELEQKGVNTTYLRKQADYQQKVIDAFDKRNTAEIRKLDAESEKLAAEKIGQELQNTFQSIVNEFAPDMQKVTLAELNARRESLVAAVMSSNASAAYNIALEALTQSQKNGVDIDNKEKPRLAHAIANKAIHEANISYWTYQSTKRAASGGSLWNTFTGTQNDFNVRNNPHRRKTRNSHPHGPGGVR